MRLAVGRLRERIRERVWKEKGCQGRKKVGWWEGSRVLTVDFRRDCWKPIIIWLGVVRCGVGIGGRCLAYI